MKKIIIPIIALMMLLCVGLAYAAPLTTTVTLDGLGTLANGSWQTSNSISYNVLVIGNLSSFECDLWTTENGSSGPGVWTKKSTGFVALNNTNTTVTRTTVKDTQGRGRTNDTTNLNIAYSWDVACNGTASVEETWGANGNASSIANNTFVVDATAPVVNVSSNYYNKRWYITESEPRIELLVQDDNIQECYLDTTYNTTGTFSLMFENFTSITNGTTFNFTMVNSSSVWGDNAIGTYLWGYRCKDRAGNYANASSNRTFFVDTTAPAAFDFNTTLWKTDNREMTNASNGACPGCGTMQYFRQASDYTVQGGWTGSVETNFSRYEMLFYPLAYGNTTGMINTTTGSNGTLALNTSALALDTNYMIRVIAYDLAGNKVNMTTSKFEYKVDSTNRELLAGWNIIGNVGQNFTLSEVMNWTGATTTSIWNSTHEFVSHVAGGSNGATVVLPGTPLLLYLSSDTNVSDWIWNVSADGGDAGARIRYGASNVTNQTASSWSLVMNKNDSTSSMTFQELDVYTNSGNLSTEGLYDQPNNITFFSYYNNSATSASKKYVTFIGNWSIANTTTLSYGDCAWMYLGNPDVERVVLNWTSVK